VNLAFVTNGAKCQDHYRQHNSGTIKDKGMRFEPLTTTPLCIIADGLQGVVFRESKSSSTNPRWLPENRKCWKFHDDNSCDCFPYTYTYVHCITKSYTGVKKGIPRRIYSHTINSSVDAVGERYRLNQVIVVTLYHLYTQFPRKVRLSRQQITPFSAYQDVFDYCA